MNLRKIFNDKDKFVKFYEKLQRELDDISEEAIKEDIETLEYMYPEEDFSKMSKLEIKYRYSQLSCSLNPYRLNELEYLRLNSLKSNTIKMTGGNGIGIKIECFVDEKWIDITDYNEW